MKKKGLFSKMLATYTVIITVSFLILATVISLWYESYYFNTNKNDLIKKSQLLSVSAIEYMRGDISDYEINRQLNIIGNYLNVDIWVTDKYGYIYAVSNNKHRNLIGKQVLINDLDLLRDKNIIEKKGNYENIFTIPVHTLEIPIINEDIFKGTIIMHISLNTIKDTLNNVYHVIWISAIIAMILSYVVIYYFSQRIIIKPLGKINSIAEKISKGEVDKRVDIKTNDEVGELAQSFNLMADSIEKVENNRRLFISNVSHEIRSPITSIKGFIRAILDDVVPKDKQNYYLNLTYDEIQRLTRLVNDLLDLSAIESGKFKLNISRVNLNEVIRLSVIKFETRIINKNLKVDVSFDEDELFVLADKDRLIQIITNLLDNSIKYSEKNGKIKINTKIKGKKAYTTIFNSGSQIPQYDLTHIWDRFYKADKSRSVKNSSGLGLSIVRSILTQLGEDIWVQNVKGGVQFTFTLTKC